MRSHLSRIRGDAGARSDDCASRYFSGGVCAQTVSDKHAPSVLFEISCSSEINRTQENLRKGPEASKDQASSCFGASLQQAFARLSCERWSLGPWPKQPMQMNLETKPKLGGGRNKSGVIPCRRPGFLGPLDTEFLKTPTSSLFPLDYRK